MKKRRSSHCTDRREGKLGPVVLDLRVDHKTIRLATWTRPALKRVSSSKACLESQKKIVEGHQKYYCIQREGYPT